MPNKEGVYIVDGGKTKEIQAISSASDIAIEKESLVSSSENPSIIIYSREIESTGPLLGLMSIEKIEKSNGKIWASIGSGGRMFECKVEPVRGKTNMIKVQPKERLWDGYYRIYLGAPQSYDVKVYGFWVNPPTESPKMSDNSLNGMAFSLWKAIKEQDLKVIQKTTLTRSEYAKCSPVIEETPSTDMERIYNEYREDLKNRVNAAFYNAAVLRNSDTKYFYSTLGYVSGSLGDTCLLVPLSVIVVTDDSSYEICQLGDIWEVGKSWKLHSLSADDIDKINPFVKAPADLSKFQKVYHVFVDSSGVSKYDKTQAMQSTAITISKRLSDLGISYKMWNEEDNSFYIGTKEYKGATTVNTTNDVVESRIKQNTKLEFYVEANPEVKNVRIVRNSKGDVLRLYDRPELTNRYVRFVEKRTQNIDGKEMTLLIIHFSVEGGRRFAQITGANIGRSMAIFIDGNLIATPLIASKVRDKCELPVNPDSAANIYEALRGGYLNCPVVKVEIVSN
jgi:hypothetical protein